MITDEGVRYILLKSHFFQMKKQQQHVF